MLSNSLASVISRKLNNERLDLITGGFIDFWSLEQPDRVRGHRYKRVIVNEAAMVADLLNVWNMIIRPTLIDFRGEADFYSTPRGLNGFYTLWQQGGNVPGWERFKYTSFDNPHIPREELDELSKVLPARVFSQEIMADFLEDGAFFQGIDKAAVILEPDQPEQHAGHYLTMGVDWALSEDFTVLTIACRECNRVVAWERFNQIDYSYQRLRVMDMANRWNVIGLLPERNSIGQPNIELLLQANLPVMTGPDGGQGFNTTATSKPQLIQALASGLEHDGFLVPADYADELRSYQVEISTAGHARFSSPSGAHDDRVISLALAWWALANGGILDVF
jgi:hypothetical protein